MQAKYAREARFENCESASRYNIARRFIKSDISQLGISWPAQQQQSARREQ